jgi:hypothetical protein
MVGDGCPQEHAPAAARAQRKQQRPAEPVELLRFSCELPPSTRVCAGAKYLDH